MPPTESPFHCFSFLPSLLEIHHASLSHPTLSSTELPSPPLPPLCKISGSALPDLYHPLLNPRLTHPLDGRKLGLEENHNTVCVLAVAHVAADEGVVAGEPACGLLLLLRSIWGWHCRGDCVSLQGKRGERDWGR